MLANPFWILICASRGCQSGHADIQLLVRCNLIKRIGFVEGGSNMGIGTIARLGHKEWFLRPKLHVSWHLSGALVHQQLIFWRPSYNMYDTLGFQMGNWVNRLRMWTGHILFFFLWIVDQSAFRYIWGTLAFAANRAATPNLGTLTQKQLEHCVVHTLWHFPSDDSEEATPGSFMVSSMRTEWLGWSAAKLFQFCRSHNACTSWWKLFLDQTMGT